MQLNQRNKLDGRYLMTGVSDNSAAIVFFDPQYREVLDKLKYGNEGVSRQSQRAKLPQMDLEIIKSFIKHIERILRPSGHCFLWIDKFILGKGIHLDYLVDANKLTLVDMIVWDKYHLGQGYRSRRTSEYLLVIQKLPKRAKGIWTDRSIPDVWTERQVKSKEYPHIKPYGLIKRLIEATSTINNLVVDPAAGSYVVLDVCMDTNRVFLGCDITGD